MDHLGKEHKKIDNNIVLEKYKNLDEKNFSKQK